MIVAEKEFETVDLVHVVMCNDFPDSVFRTVAGAGEYCALQKEATKNSRPKQYWKFYTMELKS